MAVSLAQVKGALCWLTALPVGLRELCSKSSSYSEFPQKKYHYAHYYAQNLLITLSILDFTGKIFSYNFFHFCNQKLQKYFIAYQYY